MNFFSSPIKSSEDLQECLSSGGVLVGVNIDTQIDFAYPEGALYVPTHPSVIEYIRVLTQVINYQIGSVDAHSYDSWEFQKNGGPFPAHCLKGTIGQLRIPEVQRQQTRFIPMSEGPIIVGESSKGEGNRILSPEDIANEIRAGIQVIFEKEVYDLYANPQAEPVISALVEAISKKHQVKTSQILFGLYGYAAGGYCVDAAAKALKAHGYNTAIFIDAVASLNIDEAGNPQDGLSVTREMAQANGIHIIKNEIVA